MDVIRYALLTAAAAAAGYSAWKVHKTRAKVADFFDLGTDTGDLASSTASAISEWLGLSAGPVAHGSAREGSAVDQFSRESLRPSPDETALG